jgi:isoprenylcysteine carboxyl methyltransferase (ICMT) family protein YpbQ
VAFALRNRVQVAQERVRGTFFVAAGIFVFFAIVGALLNETGFSDWWAYVGTWAMVLSWIVLVIVLVTVYRALKSGPTRPNRPPYSSNWG